MKLIMDIHEVMKYLPHRPPFLLVDGVLEMKEGVSLVAIKNVTMNEPFFVGHFPNHPVMPGVLIVEALAQAAGILAYKSTNTSPSDGILYLFAGIDNVRFRRVVLPGDQLRLEVSNYRQVGDKGFADIECFVESSKKAEVKIFYSILTERL